MPIRKIVGAIAFAVSIGFIGCSNPNKPVELDWRKYSGESQGYQVRIELLGREGLYERSVHLESEDEKIRPYAITGHDYDNDGTWDRILIQETALHGYNSILFQDDRTQVWEPCDADKDKVQRFTPKQLMQAKTFLEEAMAKAEKEGYNI